MKIRPPFFRAGERAFTLVELMVSMFVLTLLLVMITQMMNSAIAMSANSTKRLDADSQARLALDRMAVDFSQIVKRVDVDYLFKKNPLAGTGGGENDQMAFYSETGGYYPPGITSFGQKSNAALVGYRINNRKLERLNKALTWNGVPKPSAASTTTNGPMSMIFLPQTLDQAWPNIVDAGTDSDYQVIGDQVFRMEVSFLVRNTVTAAKLSQYPYVENPVAAATASAANATTGAVGDYNGLRDVVACVVTLAVLDDQSRLIVQPTDLDAAVAKLENTSGTTLTSTAAQLWQKHIDDGSLSSASGLAGLSRTAAAQVRVYERYFYLGNAQ